MRKLILTLALFLLTASVALADMYVSPQALPANSKNFISKYFPQAGIIMVEQDYDGFEVKLNTGAEIDFYANGDWKDIKAYQNFPVAALPAPVVAAIKKAHPQAFIIKAEKQWSGYEIKTSNMMEIYIDAKGNIMGQKFDD